MDCFSYLNNSFERLMRKYPHRPCYMAWRCLWSSFFSLFLTKRPFIPPAQGIYREMQLAELKILKEIDRVCRQEGLIYWIDFGTLLGAVRHGGFIPWDDDIDLSMPRCDYERFIQVFNTKKEDSFLEAGLFLNNKQNSVIIKVKHKKLSIFVDIFPIDFYGVKMTEREKLLFSQKIKKMADRPSPSNGKIPKPIALYNCCMSKSQELPFVKKKKGPTVFYGIDFCHKTHLYNAFDYEKIFPLKEILFEGVSFPCVADTDTYLSQIYGNYRRLPKKLHFHLLGSQLSNQERKILQKYVEDK